jgi:hypothetical protein
VLWSQSLDLNSLDQLEHRLQQPLWRGTGITVAQKWRFIGAGKAPEPIAAKVILSCADYWQTDHALYKTASQSDFNLLADFAGTCQALKALKAALPAQKSFVNDFTLDESAVDMLPPGIAIGRNPAERREIKQAEIDGLSWRQYQPAWYRWHARVTAPRCLNGRAAPAGWKFSAMAISTATAFRTCCSMSVNGRATATASRPRHNW